MTTYYPVQENVEKVTEFKNDPVLRPLYQCKECGHSISPEFARNTGVCGMCHDGINNIGEYLNRVYSITYYCSEFSNHSLTNSLKNEVKQGNYAEEIAEILTWGINNFSELKEPDYITPPPRGTDDANINHMKNIGEIVSEETGIPIQDPLRKCEPYTSQKQISDPEKRIDNIKNNIESIESFDSSPTIVVIDDVVTSTGTLKYSAKVLLNSVAGQVVALVVARSEKIGDLKDAKIISESQQ